LAIENDGSPPNIHALNPGTKSLGAPASCRRVPEWESSPPVAAVPLVIRHSSFVLVLILESGFKKAFSISVFSFSAFGPGFAILVFSFAPSAPFRGQSFLSGFRSQVSSFPVSACQHFSMSVCQGSQNSVTGMRASVLDCGSPLPLAHRRRINAERQSRSPKPRGSFGRTFNSRPPF